jgi:eukaryotic-like serine/threonine-protein kinase
VEPMQAWVPPLLAKGMEVCGWRVLGFCGGGVYGVAYRVERVGRESAGPCAMKLARNPEDPRFEHEGELLSRIHHPQVPRLHARGEWRLPGGVSFPFLVMDYVEGVELYKWASLQPRSQRQVLRLLAQAARALEATHAVGGVHRDVKGGNVLVRREDGAAMLMDFGCGTYAGAKILTRYPLPPGTPQYLSPESQRFEFEHQGGPLARYEAQPADDVYALGMMAYRLVTGRYPPPMLKVEGSKERPRLVSLPLEPPEMWVDLGPQLSLLLRQMLSHEPAARGSAGEVAQALERAAEMGGPEVDVLLNPRPVQVPPDPERAASRSLQGTAVSSRRPVWLRPVFAGAPWLVATVTGVLVTGTWWAAQHAWEENRRRETQDKWSRGKADAGTSGLGDGEKAMSVSAEKPLPVRSGIRADVPKQPFSGQRLPPCVKPLVEIHGGCWVGPTDDTPPCEPGSYQWKNRCYMPMFEPQRPATSEPP